MERENEPDNLDINDYHRLRYLGDNVNEILQSVLENIRAGIGLTKPILFRCCKFFGSH